MCKFKSFKLNHRNQSNPEVGTDDGQQNKNPDTLGEQSPSYRFQNTPYQSKEGSLIKLSKAEGLSSGAGLDTPKADYDHRCDQFVASNRLVEHGVRKPSEIPGDQLSQLCGKNDTRVTKKFTKIDNLVNKIEVPILPNQDTVSDLSEESAKTIRGNEGSPSKMLERPLSSPKVSHPSDGVKSLPRDFKGVVSANSIPRPEMPSLPPQQSVLLRNNTIDFMVIKQSPSKRKVEVMHHPAKAKVSMPKIERSKMHGKRREGRNSVLAAQR
jgi:hypothetical protein